MRLPAAVLDELRVEPGGPAKLTKRSTSGLKAEWPKGADGERERKRMAEEDLASFTSELAEAQELMWANSSHALLIVLQALDAAGKDGTIKHVMSGVNPQGCRVEAFKQPSSTELAHDFLWRANRALPAVGEITIFNRSYYEDVLVTKVHPELLVKEHDRPVPGAEGSFWRQRYEDINEFERHLHRNNTRIVKVFLHLSKGEQKRRFLDRLDDKDKNWKFSPADLTERGFWDDYQGAYEEALSATSTEWAPWYVVPADRKYELRALVGGVIVDTIDRMDLSAPRVAPESADALERAKQQLLAEE